MLETKGTVTLCTAKHSNGCIWKWSEQTLEGEFLLKEMWESIPADRLTLAARDGLRYTLLHGSLVSDQIGRLAEAEIKDFCVFVQDDGVYVDFIVEGIAQQRLDSPPADGSRYHYSIHMDRA